MPDSSDNYQLPSWPPTPITRDLWNAALGSIAARLTARETLEASFKLLQEQGVQASLDYIQVTVAPQLAALQASVVLAQEQIDQIVIDGISPDAAKLGGQLPAYYATSTALTNGLATKVPVARTVAGKALSADVTLVKADVGLGNVSNTAPMDMPVSTAQAEAISGRIPYYAAGSALPTANIGPIWHESYAAIMTWDGTGYASIDVGRSSTFSMTTAPAGYLVENGAAVSRVAYAGLFRKIGTTFGAGDGSTTFNLPESRGEFIRGLDSGRGVDSGRALASAQASQNLSHFHGLSTDGSHNHINGFIDATAVNANGAAIGGGSGGIFGFAIGGGNSFRTNDSGAHTHTIGSSGGSEARSRNVAKLICIKF